MMGPTRQDTFVALVVDDEPRIRDYVRTILEAAHFQILEAADGIQALEVLRDNVPDVIITDIRMPRMNGHKLAECIRTAYPGMPLIFVSGEPSGGRLHDPRNRVVFVEKPFSPDVLLGAVRRVLRPTARACG